MEAEGTLKLGVALSASGLALSLAAGLFDNTPLEGVLRPIAGLATLFGLLLLILAVYGLAGLPRTPALVLAGAADRKSVV